VGLYSIVDFVHFCFLAQLLESVALLSHRNRAILCLSVVSLNKIITRARFFYYCYLGFRFTTV